MGRNMSTAEDISLLAHLQTPILVGDPDGCIVYANPAFRSRFCETGEDPMGQPLAMVFGGGAREVVLTATAEVLERGQPARIQIREGAYGYTGLASPIEAEDDRVGVVMVLLEEQSSEDYLTGLADEIGEPIAEAMQTMQSISQSLDAGLADNQRAMFERGIRSIETAQKWLRELQVAIRGGKPQQGRFDVTIAIMRVAERVMNDTEEKVDLEVLMPPNLPRVAGTTVVFERMLTQLMRHRIGEAKSGEPLTLLARTLGGEQPRSVLVSPVDLPDSSRRDATGHPPDGVQHGMASMGGEAICVEDSSAGRVTMMRLAVANA
jgi:nitrogen-specific signal transduction histidine kinase